MACSSMPEAPTQLSSPVCQEIFFMDLGLLGTTADSCLPVLHMGAKVGSWHVGALTRPVLELKWP